MILVKIAHGTNIIVCLSTAGDGEIIIAKLTRKIKMVALGQVFRLEIAELIMHRLESNLQVILLATLHQGSG